MAVNQFKGRCNYCGRIGHKAVNCQKTQETEEEAEDGTIKVEVDVLKEQITSTTAINNNNNNKDYQ